MSEKGRENRLRRMAERQGLRLERSRRHDPLASSYGLYALKTWKTRQLVSDLAYATITPGRSTRWSST